MWNVLSPRPKRPQARVLDGVRVYAIADVHGCADLLAHVFSRIDADLASHPSSETFEVFLGDYVDRGPNSKGVIELLIKRACDRRTIFLAGNHEIYLSEFLRNPAVFDSWKQYGALLTLRSYGIRAPTNPDPNKQSELSLALKRSMPQSHQNFLDKLKPFFTCGDYFFVHAGVRPGVPLLEQDTNDLFWIRKEFLSYKGDYGKIIIHGHTPVLEPDVRSNRINIDTGAYVTGKLTCLRLQADQIMFL